MDADVTNAAKAMEQGASAFAWPFAPGTVGAVEQGLESAGIYLNRALAAAKSAKKVELQAMCVAYSAALKAMQAWVAENAKMGVTWNVAKGVAAKDYVAGAAAAPAAAAPASAAAAAPTSTASPSAAAAAPNLANLFSAISAIDQSKGKTEGLRHVTKDMKSTGSAAPATAPMAPLKSEAAGISTVKLGAPKVAEEGMRVVVEYHTKESQAGAVLTLSMVTLRQEVYIYGCK